MDDALTQLFLQIQSGETQKFATIIEHSQYFAYSLAYRLLLSRDEAEDIVQEAYIRIWQHRTDFNGQVKFTTWLYTIVSNLCIDRQRKFTRRIHAMTRYHLWRTEPFANDVEENIAQKDVSEWVLKLANELPLKQKWVFVLRDLQDMDIDEIVTITGQSSSQIKSNLYHARKNLRKRLLEMKIMDSRHGSM